MKRPVAFFGALLFLVVLPSLLLAQSNPAAGTWKLNVAKSKYSTGSPPKSGTRTVEAQGDGVKVGYELVEADGSTIQYGYAASFDDKDSPISGSGADNWRESAVGGAETIALRRLDSRAYAGALKKSGNVVMTTRTVVSKDGKVTTVTANGADAKGQPTTRVGEAVGGLQFYYPSARRARSICAALQTGTPPLAILPRLPRQA